jgi:hypothetical protein
MRSTLFLMLAAHALANCTQPATDVVELDFPVGDQCFFAVPQRPNDCGQYAPCIYSDADIRLYPGPNNQLRMEAIFGGWTNNDRDASQAIDIGADSPQALAEHTPEVLAALGAHSGTISGSCFFLNPDQATQFGDILAFHRALAAGGARKVGYYAVLAED